MEVKGVETEEGGEQRERISPSGCSTDFLLWESRRVHWIWSGPKDAWQSLVRNKVGMVHRLRSEELYMSCQGGWTSLFRAGKWVKIQHWFQPGLLWSYSNPTHWFIFPSSQSPQAWINSKEGFLLFKKAIEYQQGQRLSMVVFKLWLQNLAAHERPVSSVSPHLV